jgi:hypothetical protein
MKKDIVGKYDYLPQFTAVFLALMMHQSMRRRERRLRDRIVEGGLESAVISQCSPPTPKAEGKSLTRLENYCVVYLATLESRDVICANWRGTSVLPLRSSG